MEEYDRRRGHFATAFVECCCLPDVGHYFVIKVRGNAQPVSDSYE